MRPSELIGRLGWKTATAGVAAVVLVVVVVLGGLSVGGGPTDDGDGGGAPSPGEQHAEPVTPRDTAAASAPAAPGWSDGQFAPPDEPAARGGDSLSRIPPASWAPGLEDRMVRLEAATVALQSTVGWMGAFGVTAVATVGLLGAAWVWRPQRTIRASAPTAHGEASTGSGTTESSRSGWAGTPCQSYCHSLDGAPGLPDRRRVPGIRFVSGVVDRICAGIRASTRDAGDVEVGFALVGRIVQESGEHSIVVNGVIDDGPQAVRDHGFHRLDREYQQRELEILQMVDGEAMHVGDAHLHPGNLDRPSAGDHRTDVASVRASRSQEMVFVIVTRRRDYGEEVDPRSILRRGLKLDCYYLGASSGYEYVRVTPDEVSGEPLAVPGPLRALAEHDEVRARLDFENLRRLSDYDMSVSPCPGDQGDEQTLIRMRHRRLGFSTIVALGSDPGACLEIYVDGADGGSLRRYEPERIREIPSDLVWLTPLVLRVERELTRRSRVHCDRDKLPEQTTTRSSGERPAPFDVMATGREE